METRPFRHSLSRAARLGAVAAFAAAALAAQDAPPPAADAAPAPAGLAELERRALTDSPALVAARERLAAAEARLPAAGVLDDPMLEVELMDALPDGGRPAELRPMVTQPLPAPGKRAARRAVAAAEVAVLRAELALAERETLAELRRAWAEHWVAERERALLEEAHGVMELVEADADARLAAGRATVGEALEARRMVRRHEGEQEDADARFVAAVSRLAELAGSEPPPAIAHGEPLGDAAPPDLDIAATADSDPRVAVARARVAAAEARLAAVRLERRPDWSVGAGTRTMDGDSTELVVGVGVELPIFRRRRVEPEIAAGEREVAAARADVEAVRRAARGEIERLVAERFRLEARARRLEQALIPELEAAFEIERAALVAEGGSVAAAAKLLEESIAARLELERVRGEISTVRATLLAYLPVDPPAGGAE